MWVFSFFDCFDAWILDIVLFRECPFASNVCICNNLFFKTKSWLRILPSFFSTMSRVPYNTWHALPIVFSPRTTIGWLAFRFLSRWDLLEVIDAGTQCVCTLGPWVKWPAGRPKKFPMERESLWADKGHVWHHNLHVLLQTIKKADIIIDMLLRF